MAKRNIQGSSSGRKSSSRSNSTDKSFSDRRRNSSGSGSFKKSSKPRSYDKKDDESVGEKRSFFKKKTGTASSNRQSSSEERTSRYSNKSFDRNERKDGKGKSWEGKKFNKTEDQPRKPYSRKKDDSENGTLKRRSFDSKPSSGRSRNDRSVRGEGNKGKSWEGKKFDRTEDQPRKPYSRRKDSSENAPLRERSFNSKISSGRSGDGRKSFDKKKRFSEDDKKPYQGIGKQYDSKRNQNKDFNSEQKRSSKTRMDRAGKSPLDQEQNFNTPLQTEKIRLNRFISNSGVCSRREADELISMGLISVNGKTISELGYKVNPSDTVRYENKVLKAEKPVYILMNKPKGFLTTTDDPQERNTVMQIVGSAVKERIYPVGRLDRNTTGLLLLTNDGDLADKLMHPSYNVKKIYKVELDRPLSKADFQKIIDGIFLEEGRVMVDDLAIVSPDGKTVGIELHIGWNRVVRRIFESLEYEVIKLDRSVYAGLDKKDLSRGQWRFLTKDEVVRLKHFK